MSAHPRPPISFAHRPDGLQPLKEKKTAREGPTVGVREPCAAPPRTRAERPVLTALGGSGDLTSPFEPKVRAPSRRSAKPTPQAGGGQRRGQDARHLVLLTVVCRDRQCSW